MKRPARGNTRGNRKVKNKKRTRRRAILYKKGGAVIGAGAFGVVTKPPPCAPGTFRTDEVGKLILKKEAAQELRRLEEVKRRLPGELSSFYKFFLESRGECIPDPTNEDIRDKFAAPPQAAAAGGINLSVPALVESIDNYTVLRYADAGESIFGIWLVLSGYNDFKAHGALTKSVEEYNEQLYVFLKSLHKLFYTCYLLNRAGIAHRDIKAGNITVGPDRELTLIDFGLAIVKENAENELISGTTGYSYLYWPWETCVLIDPYGFLNLSYDTLQDVVDAVFKGKSLRSPVQGKNRDARHFRYLDVNPPSSENIQREFFVMVNSVKQDCKRAVLHGGSKYSLLGEYILLDENAADPTNIYFDINSAYRFVKYMLDDPSKKVGDNLTKFNQIIALITEMRIRLYEYFDVFGLGMCLIEILDGIQKTLKFELNAKNTFFMENLILLCKRMIQSDIPRRGTMLENLGAYEGLEKDASEH